MSKQSQNNGLWKKKKQLSLPHTDENKDQSSAHHTSHKSIFVKYILVTKYILIQYKLETRTKYWRVTCWRVDFQNEVH